MIPQIDIAAVAPMIPVALGVLCLPMLEVLLLRTPTLLGQNVSAARRGTYLATASFLFLAASLLLTLNAFSGADRACSIPRTRWCAWTASRCS